MNNKETLQSYNTRLTTNNADLQILKTKINNLPTYENLDAEIAAQNTLLTDNETIAEDILSLLENNNPSTGVTTVPVSFSITYSEPGNPDYSYMKYFKNIDGIPTLVEEPFVADTNYTYNVCCNTLMYMILKLPSQGWIMTDSSTVTLTEGLLFGPESPYNVANMIQDPLTRSFELSTVTDYEATYGYLYCYSACIQVKEVGGTITATAVCLD